MTEELDQRLIRAMNGGTADLPEDLEQLTVYVRMINESLKKKSLELEATLALADANAEQIQKLQELSLTVAEKAGLIEARAVKGVIIKFRIFRDIGEGAEQACHVTAIQDRLATSIEADLVSIAAADRPDNRQG